MASTLPTPIALARIDNTLVDHALKIVDSSGVCDLLATWRAEDGYTPSQGGRPASISDRAALALMLMLGIQGDALHVTRARDILVYQTTKKGWLALGLGEREFDRRQDFHKQWYERLWYSVHRVLKPMNPYPETSVYRCLDKQTYAQLKARRVTEQVIARKQRAATFSNALVAASARTLGKKNLAQWDGTVVTDGTPLQVSRRGEYKTSNVLPSTPMAGWYAREGDHKSDSSDPKKTMWAFELTLTAMHGDNFGGAGKFPSLIAGMSFDKPGHRIAQNAMTSLERVINDPTVPKGYFIGDRAYYPNAKPEKLQIPLRQAGYKLAGDFRADSPVVQGQHEGAVLVDGQWFCPVISSKKNWLNARTDFANGTIDRDQLDDILVKRQQLAMKVKNNNADGSVRLECPARGSHPTVVCPLVAGVRDKRKKPKALLPIIAKEIPAAHVRGKACTAKSFEVPIEAGAKYAAHIPWETDKWREVYKPARSTIESRNDALKSARGVGIGDSTSRMIRGFIGQMTLAAIGVAALNVRLVQAWTKKKRRAKATSAPTPPDDGSAYTSHDGAESKRSQAPPVAA